MLPLNRENYYEPQRKRKKILEVYKSHLRVLVKCVFFVIVDVHIFLATNVAEIFSRESNGEKEREKYANYFGAIFNNTSGISVEAFV